MTREEAIKIIDCYDIGFYDLSGEKIPADKLAEVFYMATEALQTPPISQRSMYQAGYRQAQEDRPRGQWADEEGNQVPLNEDGETTNSCWCSECGEWLVASDEYPTRGNFCPNCGADMRGERSE